MTRIQLLILALLSAYLATSCTRRPAAEGPYVQQSGADDTDAIAAEPPNGLVIRLSDAVPGAGSRARVAEAETQRLSDREANKLLARLPALKTGKDDRKTFAKRKRSLPPPRTGATIQQSFPAKPTGRRPKSGKKKPVRVVRHAPEGEVPLAPHLSMTFSEAMVAITSHADLAAQSSPVRLEPTPPGRWRWVGTKTLMFQPEGRFPMATDYRVTVPKGTKASTGQRVAKPKSWTFSTPPPGVVVSYPVDQPVIRDPLTFVQFDQAIDRKAVAQTIQYRVGRKRVAVRLVKDAAVRSDEHVSALVDAAEDGRWLAFRPVRPLPSDSAVTVEIGPGTPSGEGPKKTKAVQAFGFRTYGPLKVVDSSCGYDRKCPPGTPFQIELSNPIDTKQFDKSLVAVEPALPGVKTEVYGNYLYVYGTGKARTTYKVTLASRLPDTFGQILGRPETLKFRVTAPPKSLSAQGAGMVVLDPAAGPKFSVYSTSHRRLKVRAYAVGPRDWNAYLKFIRDYQSEGRETKPPGREVLADTIKVQGDRDEISETRIDLSKALSKGRGHVVVIVEPARKPVKRWERQRVISWVQATGIGLDAFVDSTDLVGWATNLADGKPLAGVELELYPKRGKGRTGKDGLATLPLTKRAAQLLIARKGDDVAILPQNTYWWGGEGGWLRSSLGDALRWFVFDDRKMYRPGEKVRIKGWVRRVGLGKGGDVGALRGAVRKVGYKLMDSQGNQVRKGKLELNALGGFDTSLTLPKTMNLGGANLMLQAEPRKGVAGTGHFHVFQVQEFRRPEYEVTVGASEGPHIVGGSAELTVEAAYYAGGGLQGAETNWRVSSQPGSFVPPNRDDFTFGKWRPWWGMFWRGDDTSELHRSDTHAAHTDGAGKHHLKMDFVSVRPPQPMSVHVEASVTDVNRQAWTTSTDLVVHPATHYVGLRSEKLFVRKGEKLEVDAIVVDLDGKAVVGSAIELEAARIEWEQDGGEFVEKEVDPQTCTKKSSKDAARCRFDTPEGGMMRVRAHIEDPDGRRNTSELTLWVAGGKTPPPRNVAQEQVTLIPAKKDHPAGEIAEILVMAPFSPAEGVVTLRRSGLEKVERFSMKESSHTLKVKLDPSYVPNVTIQVDLVGAAERRGDSGELDPELPKRPAFASGLLNLEIPPNERTLAVAVAPKQEKIEPGGKTSVDLTVTDAGGRPVQGAEVALVVVDEAVLALTGYQLPDPLAVFYTPREPGVADHHMRNQVLLANPEDTTVTTATGGLDKAGAGGGGRFRSAVSTPQSAPGAGPPPAPPAEADAAEAAPVKHAPRKGKLAEKSVDRQPNSPIAMRANFDALALFAPEVATDAAGKATVAVELPDNLTRYRVMAVAIARDREFGAAESTITARLPLMVRPSAPRFLNFGDRFELPVVVQNQTDKAMRVKLAIRASNAELTAGAGRGFEVAANDRVEVRFPTAAALPGTARFQVAAAAGEWSDAATFELPVWTPATAEAFATYGEVDKGAIVQPVKAPSGVFSEFGGLEITTSSTAVQALTDAVLYLVSYPFECNEQLASRVLAVAALKDVLTAFEAEGLPEPKAMIAGLKRDLGRLSRVQNSDGGFSFWRRDDRSWPYLTVHVAHAVTRAKDKGFKVPKTLAPGLKRYLQRIEQHIPSWYPLSVRRTIVSYALYVRNLRGDRDAAKARKLVRQAGLDKLSFEAIGWLLPVLSGDHKSADTVTQIRRHLENRVTETAAAAHFATSYADGGHLLLHSNRRADGILLDALIGDQPNSDVIPKLVRGLLGHRRAGRWSSTQENAFVLLALDRYFRTYEKATPNFVARAWLGDGFAGEHAFRGRTTERHHIEIAMADLQKGDRKHDLVVQKDGKGRLYYRIGLRYAPSDLSLPPLDEGFAVERVYEPVDEDDDVRRDEDGVWHIEAGARVRVRVTMVAPTRRYHVALVDPVPAGLEVVNPGLAVSGSVPQDPKQQKSAFWWWLRPWYEHQNMRDERVEAFSSLVWAGVHEYVYVARATTPGTFVVPPPKAEEMYHPETFGRGAGDRVIVE